MYNFPVNTIGCYNDTDCGIGGKCNIVSSSNKLWCNCPRSYNPLDNCKSYYYDYTGKIIHIIYLCVSIILNIGLLIIIRKHIKSEYLIWNNNKYSLPRPKSVVIMNLILCNLCSIISAVLNLLELSLADFIFGSIFNTLLMMCVIHIMYYFFIIIIRSKSLGNLNIKWKFLSILIIILGDSGLFLASLSGIIRDVYYPQNVILTNINVIFLVIGIPIPILIGMVVYIIGLKQYSKISSKSITILKKLTWLVLTINVYVIFSLILILFLSFIFPWQLFDVITMYKFTASGLSYIQRVLFTIFIMLTKISDPNALSTTNSESSNKSKDAKISTENVIVKVIESDNKTSSTLSN